MSDTYVIAVDGLSAYRTLDTLPTEVKRAALQAVNRTAERARTASARSIREQVNFPARYLSGSQGRLTLDRAKDYESPEAVITGRFRPTSLARFVTSGRVGGTNGVRLEVAPGFAKRSRRMFLIRLPAGSGTTDTKSNMGLAIRLRPGEAIDHKHRMVAMSRGLYLLFGPSVNQVFSTVAADQAPGAADFLEGEFLRLMELYRG
jgi:hypothetical protein